MPAYDTSFKPPAPVADVKGIHPTTGVESSVLRGKLDTGADLSVIPDQLIGQLGNTERLCLDKRLRRDLCSTSNLLCQVNS